MNDRFEKDARLGEDIRLLGRILGDTIRAYEGEAAFALVEEETGSAGVEWSAGIYVARRRPEPLARRITPEEIAAHQALIASLGPHPLWSMYLDVVEGAAAA